MTHISSTYPLSSRSQSWRLRSKKWDKASLQGASDRLDKLMTSKKLSSALDEFWRWGVDTGARRVAIACHRNGVRHTASVREFDSKRQLSADLAFLRKCVLEVVAELAPKAPPIIVCVEQPSGRWRNPPLTAAYGVILEGLHAGLREHFGHPPMILSVPPSQWKSECLANGNANTASYLAAAKLRFGHDLVADDPDLAAALWLCDYADSLEIS